MAPSTDPSARMNDARRPLWDRALALLAWSLVSALFVLAGARLLFHDASFSLIALGAFTAWVFLPAYLALVVGLWRRRPALSGAAAVLSLLHLAWTVPGALPAPGSPAVADGSPGLRLMTANLLAVNPDPTALCDEIRARDPDVLLVQELSPRWLAAFEESGLLAHFPHALYEVREDSFGAGIFSRLPLDRPERLDLLGVPLLRATVQAPGGDLRVYNVHPLPPRTPQYAAVWQRQMARLEEELAAEPGALVAAGDFNATPHARWYQRLTRDRLRGAHEDHGRGLASTWPNGIFPLPPIRLDHVLLSPELAVLAIDEGRGQGSDHRPVIADLAFVTVEGSVEPPPPSTG